MVFAHAACELHTEGELIRLLALRSDRLLCDLVMPSEREIKSLANPYVMELYCALTDDYPAGRKDPKQAQAEWWAEWCASRKDRHQVAHKGAQMSRPQADLAISVADRYTAHVRAKVEAAREKLLRERQA